MTRATLSDCPRAVRLNRRRRRRRRYKGRTAPQRTEPNGTEPKRIESNRESRVESPLTAVLSHLPRYEHNRTGRTRSRGCDYWDQMSGL